MKPPNIFIYSYLYPATSLNCFKELSLDQIASTVDQSLPVNSFTVASLSEERLRRTTPTTFFDYTQLLILYGNPSASPSPPTRHSTWLETYGLCCTWWSCSLYWPPALVSQFSSPSIVIFYTDGSIQFVY